MFLDAYRLISASNDVTATMSREAELDDVAGLAALVASGKQLYDVLGEVGADDGFWDDLRDAEPTTWEEAGERADDLAVFFGAQHVAILQLLGYKPPPPVQELVDETIEAVRLLREQSSDPDVRTAAVYQARAALRTFTDRLGGLLEERGIVSRPVRRSLLRRALARGARILVIVAPIALGYGAKAVADAQGIPADFINDTVQALGSVAAGSILAQLPEDHMRQLEVSVVLGELEARAKARALASVVRSQLLRLPLSKSDARCGSLIAAAEALGTVVERSLQATKAYDESIREFALKANALFHEPSEARLIAALDAWRQVQEMIELMKEKPSKLTSALDELERERRRRAIDDPGA